MKEMPCFGKSSANNHLVFKVLIKNINYIVREITDLSHLRWVGGVTADAFEIRRKPVMEPEVRCASLHLLCRYI